jgi:hypothetical protein
VKEDGLLALDRCAGECVSQMLALVCPSTSCQTPTLARLGATWRLVAMLASVYLVRLTDLGGELRGPGGG